MNIQSGQTTSMHLPFFCLELNEEILGYVEFAIEEKFLRLLTNRINSLARECQNTKIFKWEVGWSNI